MRSGCGGGRWGAGRPPARFESVKGVWPRGLPARSAKRSASRPNPSAFPRPLGLLLVPRAKLAGRGGVWGPGGGAVVSPGSSGELGKRQVPARRREVPRLFLEPRAGSGGSRPTLGASFIPIRHGAAAWRRMGGAIGHRSHRRNLVLPMDSSAGRWIPRLPMEAKQPCAALWDLGEG